MNLLDIIFPEKCLYCKKYGKYICDDCFKKLNNKSILRKVNNDYFDYVICGSVYQGKIRVQLHNFKFHEQSYLYKYFIELILNDFKLCKFLRNFDYITYVPMSKNKMFLRGYNQSELLAQELGKSLNIPVVKLVEKIKENKVQSSLSKQERINNVKDVYKFIENSSVQNKNIILVDDILTTGATVRVISKMLKENKINKICIFTISKTKYIIHNIKN